MKLSSFFKQEFLIRDAEVKQTHYGNSILSDTFTFAQNEDFINKSNKNDNITGIITSLKLSEKVAVNKGLVISENIKRDFFEFHNYLFTNHNMQFLSKSHISRSAKISSTVKIGKNVFIGENVEIGHYTIIEDNSFIDDNAIIGNQVVIGARGLHNTRISEREFAYVYDAGGVIIGKNCEILTGCVIQKSYFCDATSIGDNTKLGIGVNIGHGTKIGKFCLITGKSNIAGFCTIGNDVWIGPSSTLAHGLSIGDGANIKLGSVVVNNIDENENVSGNFAYNHKKHIKDFIKLKKSKK